MTEEQKTWHKNLAVHYSNVNAKIGANIRKMMESPNLPVKTLTEIYAEQARLGDTIMWIKACIAQYCPPEASPILDGEGKPQLAVV